MSVKTRTIVNDINSSRICIDDYHQGDIYGRIYHVSLDQPIYFHGLLSLVREMDQHLDAYDFPQAGMQLRSFSTKESNMASREDQAAVVTHFSKEYIRGKLATFRTRILYRQNATWQGSIRWMEGDKEEKFRSVLEMMMLMDSCFTGERPQKQESQFKESVVS